MREEIQNIVGKKGLDPGKIEKALEKSLGDGDFYGRASISSLKRLGLDKNEALRLLAQYKSEKKYGYKISPSSLSHILSLAKEKENEAPLQQLVESPFFLLKSCWLFEHAPYFFFFEETKQEDIDAFIIKFAIQYDMLFISNQVATEAWGKITHPKRVLGVTFWEKRIFDPLALLERAREENLEGLEFAVDFHPFNYAKLLPEELTAEKREKIREARGRSGAKLDIHSPIVGPYAPFPDPSKGRQLFFDPLECFDLQCETIDLAKDIGAGSVVVHFIDSSNLKKMADLVMHAGGSGVRVTLENYCQTKDHQTADLFIASIDEIFRTLPPEVRRKNFGITFDVGHLNIEGEDPLLASEKIGRWCLDRNVFLRLHATDNYGKLLFSPPAYSADVHGRVSGRGINNAIIIKLLRSLGLRFDVAAEQIQPLLPEDIAIIQEAQVSPLYESYEEAVSKGKEQLGSIKGEPVMSPEVVQEDAYFFLAGIEGISSLREHLLYRKIQDKKYLSVDEAKKVSLEFAKMPKKFQTDLVSYMDDLLLSIQSESGAIQKSEQDLICQNISSAVFSTLKKEHLAQIFSQTAVFNTGDVICEQNRHGQEMYLVKEGDVAVFLDGSPAAFLGPGEIFSEINLFYHIKRTATVKAVKDKTAIGILTRLGFETLLKKCDPHSHDLIKRFYGILPERLRSLNDKYKTAINALYLILEPEEEVPRLEDIQPEIQLKRDLVTTITLEEATEVFHVMRVFDPNQPIFSEGDRGDGAYYVLEGRVKAVTFSSDKKELLLGEMGPGEVFGEMALIDDKPRSASLVSLTPSKMGFVDRPTFDKFIETGSDLAYRLMSLICLTLYRRILGLDRVYSDVKKVFE